VPVSSESAVSGVKYRWTSFAKGFPVLTKEDRDGDGYFETTVSYGPRGARESVLVDRNANRVPEYRETYGKDGSSTLAWDSDENGSFEISYSVNALGVATAVWLQPGTGKPVTCVAENGAPRSVEIDGMTIAVLKDPIAPLWWLGRIPKDSRSIVKNLLDTFNADPSAVVYDTVNVAGRRILAVRTGGILFAELLDE